MIAILSDFGQTEYTGVIKAVIYSIAKKTKVFGLNYHIFPQNVIQGAWILKTCYKYFPKNTVFLCIVDPSVGSQRKPIYIRTKNYHFIGPDNGLMQEVAEADGIKTVSEIIPKKSWNVSNTFHGRDLFARAAALIEAKKKIKLKKLPKSSIRKANLHPKNKYEGMIVNIDVFGNIITNITAWDSKAKTKITYDGMEALIDKHKTYQQGNENELFVIEGSANTFEFSVKNKSAVPIFDMLLAEPKIGKKIQIE